MKKKIHPIQNKTIARFAKNSFFLIKWNLIYKTTDIELNWEKIKKNLSRLKTENKK